MSLLFLYARKKNAKWNNKISILSEKVSLSVKIEKRLLFLERFTKVLYIFKNSLIMRNIFLISLFLFISNCSFNLVDDHHGVYFLEKKIKKIQVNSTNKNDLIKILGEPSTKSSFDNDVWIYIERKITNTHFLGKRELVVNNVLVLEIDDLGLLAKMDFYNIEDMNKLNFDKDSTIITLRKRSFIYDFLASMRQKVNDPLGVRKKRREEGQ